MIDRIPRLSRAPLAQAAQLPWQQLLGYLRPHRWRMLIAIIGLVISSAVGLAFPLLIGQTVAEVLAACDLALLNQFVLLLVGLFALMGVAVFVETYFLTAVGERIVYALRTALYRHILSLSLDFFTQRSTGELISRLSNDVTLVRTLLTTTITTLLGAVITLVGSLVVMLALNPVLTLLLLVLAPVLVVVASVLGRPLERMSTRVQDDLAHSTGAVEEGLSNMRVVKSFAREGYEGGRYDRALGAMLLSALRVARLRAGFDALLTFLGFAAIAAILWVAGQQVIAGAMTVGLITSFLIYGVQIAESLSQLATIYGQVREATGAFRRVFELLGTQLTVRDAPDAVALPPLVGRVTFAGVAFAYDEQPKAKDESQLTGQNSATTLVSGSPSFVVRPLSNVLHDIHLDIAPGEIVAFVGPSGAGKSTLFNLILRLYDPTQGAVCVDGYDLRHITATSLRAQIGLVPQETALFAGSVRENIRYGRLDAADDEIIAAAQAAHADEFITRFPSGYDTIIGERGQTLSGGQRQRLAIARAILKNPRILLLDEATSALDTESERLVQAALNTLMRGRTTLVIAHRLSTIQAAHRIVALDHGRVVEVGTHAELLARGGLYARLYAMQFGEETVSGQPTTVGRLQPLLFSKV